MRKFVWGVIVIVAEIVWELLLQWSLVDAVLQKLKGSGATGVFIASLIMSAVLRIALLIVAIFFVAQGVKEIRKNRSSLSPRESELDDGKQWYETPLSDFRGERSLLEDKTKDKVTQAESKLEPEPKPVFRLFCKRAHVIPTKMFNGVISNENEVDDKTLYSAVLEFVVSPNARGWVSPVPYLSAQITFYDSQEQYFGRIPHVFWMNREASQFTLDPGDVARLVVAVGLLPSKYGKFAIENQHPRSPMVPEKPALELVGDDRFKVQVCLRSSDGLNEVTLYDLTCRPDFTIQKTDLDEATNVKKANLHESIDKLIELSQEGETLLMKARNAGGATEDIKQNIVEWELRTQDYLISIGRRVDAALFISNTALEEYSIAAATTAHRNMLNWIHSRVVRLNRIIEKLNPAES